MVDTSHTPNGERLAPEGPEVVKMEQSYLVLNNQRLNNYAVTFGGGKNLSHLVSANAGIAVGRRGNASLSQIQENYVQFNVGITLKDIWFGTKKFGRYN